MAFRTQEGYSARTLTCLPLTTSLSGGPDVRLDYLQEHQFWQGYILIQDAARRGDNMGLDEFPDVESYKYLIRYAHCFAIQHSVTYELLGLVMVRPDLFCSRTCDPCLAEIRVVLADGAMEFLADFVSKGENLAIDLDLGYWACLVQVAIPCLEWITTLRSLGYLTVAMLPRSVNHVQKGMVENCKMYKRLPVAVRPKRPIHVIKELMDRLMPNVDDYKNTSLPSIPCLPLTWTFSNGTDALLRNQTHGDDLVLYGLVLNAAQSGHGYGSDEIPCLSFFRSTFMAIHTCILEDRRDNSLIGAVFFEPSLHRRTTRHEVCSITVALKPGRRNAGVGRELLKISHALAKELKYSYSINESLATNVQVQTVLTSTPGVVFVGCLPEGAYLDGMGWVDTRFDFLSLENSETLAEMGLVMQEGRSQAKPKSRM